MRIEHSGCAAGKRYALPAILLHWLQAALVLWLLWLGWSMVELPKGAERSAAYGLHKSLGLLSLGLVVLRLAVRRLSPAPPQLSAGREAALAIAVHYLLYLLLLALPLAGYLASAFTPYALKFFGVELPRIVMPDELMNDYFKRMHLVAGWMLATLVSLHVAAAVRHVLRRDGVFLRMLPARPLSKN